MAMVDAWIKLRTKLPKDGRLRVSSRKCHAPSVTDVADESQKRNALVTLALGALVRLWCLADEHADQDGVLLGYTPADVDTEVGVPGFCASLPADWIDLTGEWVKLPDYQDHNGTTGKSRAQATKRKQKERSANEGGKSSRGKRDASATGSGQESRSDSDSGVTREEKNREEQVGNSSTSVKTEERTDAEARACVFLAQALKRMGMLDAGVERSELLAMARAGVTPENACLTAADLALRDANLRNDPDVHPDLRDLFASGATMQQMCVTPDQHKTLRACLPTLQYLAGTIFGRASDAARKQAQAAKQTNSKAFKDQDYGTASLDQLDPQLRAAAERHLPG